MRKNIEKDSYCAECGKYFNYLGFARHRAMHAEKRNKAKNEKLANDFNKTFPVGSTVFWKLPDIDKIETYTVSSIATVISENQVCFRVKEHNFFLAVKYVQHHLFIQSKN